MITQVKKSYMQATEALDIFVLTTLKNLTLPMDYDRAYGAQCVDLIRYWLAFNALTQISTKPSGYAYDLANNCPTNLKTTDVKTAQAGDIFVMPKSASLPYGHTGIVTSSIRPDGKVATIEANWDGKAKNPPMRQDKKVSSFACLIRPPQFSEPDVQPDQPQQAETCRWRAKSLTNVRQNPDSKSAITGSRFLIKGDTFIGLAQTVNGADPYNDGRNQWVRSAKGNYVWAANLEKA